MVVRGQRGPCNGGLFWARPLAGPNLVNLNLAKAVIKHLRVTNESGAEQPVLYNQITISTVIRDRVCLAYIMQQSLIATSQGLGFIQVIFAACIAAQYLESGILNKKDVVAQHCTCCDEEARAMTEHLCTVCYITRTCAQLAIRITADGPVLECVGCISRSASPTVTSHKRNVKNTLMTNAVTIHTRDSKVKGPAVPWSPVELVNHLVATYAFKDDATAWSDEYSDKIRYTSQNGYPKKWKIDPRLASKHPHTISIERPFSRLLRSDGVMTLHDVDNVILTSVGVNMIKGSSLSSSLPLLKKALRLKRTDRHRPPRVAYYNETDVD
jgi:hypothetical protein